MLMIFNVIFIIFFVYLWIKLMCIRMLNSLNKCIYNLNIFIYKYWNYLEYYVWYKFFFKDIEFREVLLLFI